MRLIFWIKIIIKVLKVRMSGGGVKTGAELQNLEYVQRNKHRFTSEMYANFKQIEKTSTFEEFNALNPAFKRQCKPETSPL
jgi:hypothetical protein